MIYNYNKLEICYQNVDFRIVNFVNILINYAQFFPVKIHGICSIYYNKNSIIIKDDFWGDVIEFVHESDTSKLLRFMPCGLWYPDTLDAITRELEYIKNSAYELSPEMVFNDNVRKVIKF